MGCGMAGILGSQASGIGRRNPVTAWGVRKRCKKLAGGARRQPVSSTGEAAVRRPTGLEEGRMSATRDRAQLPDMAAKPTSD